MMSILHVLTPCSQKVTMHSKRYQRRKKGRVSVVVDVAVTGQDLALELLGILVPELSSFRVQRRIAT